MYPYVFIYVLIYVFICMYIYIYLYMNMYISKSDTYFQIRHRMCVSKYGIKIKSHNDLRECFPMVWSESQRLHHYHMGTPPHSLHRLDLPVLLLSTNVCVSYGIYMYMHTFA